MTAKPAAGQAMCDGTNLTYKSENFFSHSIFFYHNVVCHNLGYVSASTVPLSHISEVVYKTSADWINHRYPEALSFFLLWSLDSILADLGSQQTVTKGSKKVVQEVTSKSQETLKASVSLFPI
ncbi:hypothetical protein KIW84_035663 [Lathyrus oleraceus]|uniref:Uncharacterized protein n=1 Tax=Pisum sativum TaxID=3888 RepID=A0A9D4Y604_PEA|nr:hypothetical protein KIW84_035663 [Pisum sativum]